LDAGLGGFRFSEEEEVRGDDDAGEHETDGEIVAVAAGGGAVEGGEVSFGFAGVGGAAEGAREEAVEDLACGVAGREGVAREIAEEGGACGGVGGGHGVWGVREEGGHDEFCGVEVFFDG
jgi:hypothetical protein